VGIFFYGLFMILCPLVFRYAIFSSIQTEVVVHKYRPFGNATMEVTTSWPNCASCLGVGGFTLGSLTIETFNVTDPDIKAGFPSIAVFASQDFEHW
jgi:hypothetical protein